MTGQQTARVLNLDATLEKRFHQIAQCSGNNDEAGDDHPIGAIEIGKIAADDPGNRVGEHQTADPAFPCFLGRYAFEEFVLAEKPTGKVAAGIAGPQDEKEAQDVLPMIMRRINSLETEQVK